MPFKQKLSTLINNFTMPDTDEISAKTRFDELRFQNLVAFTSYHKDRKYYNLDLIIPKLLEFEIPGTGLSLVINPPDPDTNTITTSMLNVDYMLNWPAMRYFRIVQKKLNEMRSFRFKRSDFATGSMFRDLTNVFWREFRLTSVDLMKSIALSIVVKNADLVATDDSYDQVRYEDAIQPIIDDINTRNGSSITLVEPTIEGLIAAAADAGLNVMLELVEIIESFELDEAAIILPFLINNNHRDLSSFLMPQAIVRITNPHIGIKIPREYLEPVNSSNVPSGKNAFVRMSYGALSLHWPKGIYFDKQLTFSLDRCRVMGTQIILEVTNLKVDFSKTTNIPEAISDGRPADFRGIFISEGEITFPYETDDGFNTGIIKTYNLLLGTGGISGKITLSEKSSGIFNPKYRIIL